jgi:hypothetical protein
MRKDRYEFLKENFHLLDIDLEKGIITNRNAKSVDGKGYLLIRVSGKLYKQHEVIAVAGGLDIIDKTINHKDTNKLNNRIDNLEIMSNLENMRHAFKNGIFNDRRIPVGSEQGSSKLTEDQVLEIRKRLINGESCTLISKDYNVVPQTIGKIKLNQRWKHVAI